MCFCLVHSLLLLMTCFTTPDSGWITGLHNTPGFVCNGNVHCWLDTRQGHWSTRANLVKAKQCKGTSSFLLCNKHVCPHNSASYNKVITQEFCSTCRHDNFTRDNSLKKCVVRPLVNKQLQKWLNLCGKSLNAWAETGWCSLFYFIYSFLPAFLVSGLV